MDATPIQRLASIALGTDVVGWVTARRLAPAKPSFRTIANELKAATGGAIDVNDETVRLWIVEELKRKHGACPNHSHPVWHNGDPCPNAEQVAS
jgi:hypothetical protein